MNAADRWWRPGGRAHVARSHSRQAGLAFDVVEHEDYLDNYPLAAQAGNADE